MARKTFRIQAEAERARLLSRQLRAYADAAYPPGASECAQSAHAALSEAADSIEYAADAGAYAEISVRLRAMMKAAVRYHYQDGSGSDSNNGDRELALMLRLAAGEAVDTRSSDDQRPAIDLAAGEVRR